MAVMVVVVVTGVMVVVTVTRCVVGRITTMH